MRSSSGSSRWDRVRVGEVRVRVRQRRHPVIDLARRPGDVAPRFPEVDLHRRAGKRAMVHEGLLRLPPRDHVDQRGRGDLARRLRRRGPPPRRKQRGRVRRGHLLDRGDAALQCRNVTASHCSGRPTPANLTRRADPRAPFIIDDHAHLAIARSTTGGGSSVKCGPRSLAHQGPDHLANRGRGEVGVSPVGGGLRGSLAHAVLVLRDKGAARRCWASMS